MTAFGVLLVSACVVMTAVGTFVPRRDVFSNEIGTSLEKCVASLPNAVDVDPKFDNSSPHWYILYMNQRDLTRVLNMARTGAPQDKCLDTVPCRTLTAFNSTIGHYSNCNNGHSAETWVDNKSAETWVDNKNGKSAETWVDNKNGKSAETWVDNKNGKSAETWVDNKNGKSAETWVDNKNGKSAETWVDNKNGTSAETWIDSKEFKHIHGLVDWTNTKPDGTLGASGHSLTGITDNQSYKLILKCWEDGTMGFIVFSHRPRLSQKSQKEIRDYLDSVGFCPFERVTAYHADLCPRIGE